MKNSKLKKFLGLSAALLMGTTAVFSGYGCLGTPSDPTPNTANHIQYLAADGEVAGREITAGQYSKDDYNVGVFYHLWHGDFGIGPGAQGDDYMTEIFNIQYMLDTQQYTTLFDNQNLGAFHYWNEPLYGYYNPNDPWVLTRHVELFTMADVDFICVDTTNTAGPGIPRLFTGPVTALLNVLATYKDQGFDVPGVTFYTNTQANMMVTALYETYYQSGQYDDLWYAPNGKPLIVGVTENNKGGTDQNEYDPNVVTTDADLLDYFELKDSKWPTTANNILDQTNAMPWMSWDKPEIFSASQRAERDGYVAVPVAQHGHATKGHLLHASACNPESHRGYNNETEAITGDWKDGLSFQQMWDKVHKNKSKIKTVMATGWNEWIAQKQGAANFGNAYVGKPTDKNTTGVSWVDVYNNEYSRDMEMMRTPGGYADNYYLQLVYNIRKLKLEAVKNPSFPTATLDINSSNISEIWDNVGTEYLDFAGDALNRNFCDATGKNNYTLNSKRNDITKIKVTNDDTYYYFYVETAENVIQYTNGTNWMNIFIGTEYGANTFGGFNYVINRAPNGNTTSVHQYNGSGWTEIGTAELAVDGNVMMVSVPMSLFNRSATQTEIRFKVSDNVQNWFIDTNTEHIMDYYVSGDSAPIGRLGFTYGC